MFDWLWEMDLIEGIKTIVIGIVETLIRPAIGYEKWTW